MSTSAGPSVVAAAVVPTADALVRRRPLDAGAVTITGGHWSDRIRTNRDRSILHGYSMLAGPAGNLANFRLAAGASGRYQALVDTSGAPFPFLDSDVYKWLEAVAWELAREPHEAIARAADEAIGLIAAAQQPDGYVNTFVQVVNGGRRYGDLAWGHEMYCTGHLIQAAVAWSRALGDDRLLTIARGAADELDRTFGADREGIDGHPEVEMALVELYRVTGEARYLDLAARLVDLRGYGLLPTGRFGVEYWQDHAPVREAPGVVGHAVRQLYLECGAVDIATERGDQPLLDAVIRRWDDMVATRMYVTGGLGSRHKDEAFGDPYELPPDRAYTETCAAIASVMLAWRLLLATGEPRFADLIERTMLNGVLPGVSTDGEAYFYTNPLQRRTHRVTTERAGTRKPWYPCACCPPNLMRAIGSWQQLLASMDDEGLALHQYATCTIDTAVGGGQVRLELDTDQPWDGPVRVTVRETPPDPWRLALRVPAWSRTATLVDPTGAQRSVAPGEVALTRTWQPGDTLTLTLDTDLRVVEPHPRVDAIRGCVALERGPVVLAIETADLPPDVELEDVALPADLDARSVPRSDLAEGAIGVDLAAVDAATDRPIRIGAIPYALWANRSAEGMRVWIPRLRG